MKLALLQPTFAPNLYDMAAMMQADRVVLQDLETWSRKGRVHRALVRTPSGTQYLNIPVLTKDRKKPVREVRIDQTSDWIQPILQALTYNYRNSLYFDHYEPEVRADFEEGKHFDLLLPFVLFLRHRLFSFLQLDIKKRELLASGLSGYAFDPDELARRLSADILFQEHGSRHYQRQAAMRSDPEFVHPRYRQHFDGFKPWCSLYDLLFQYGPESYRIME